MSDTIKFNEEAKNLLKQGVDLLANSVKITLGPKGRNVIILNNNTAHITKDGVTIAKSINNDNPFIQLGIQVIKEAAAKTVEEVGDGTTSVTLLTQYIISQGFKYITLGANPIELKEGMLKASKEVLKYLDETSNKIFDLDNIINIATTSANNDIYIGKLLGEIVDQIGPEGLINVEESTYKEDLVEINKGMVLNQGFMSPVFINNESKNTVEYENPLFYITENKLENISQIKETLSYAKNQNLPLVIIASDFSNQLISDLSLNNAKGIIQVCPVKLPGYGDYKSKYAKDIMIYTGEYKYSTLGTSDKVIISDNSTIIIGGKHNTENLNKRVETLKSTITNTKNLAEIKNLKKRIANLVGGVAIIYVGAASELEMKEKKDRIDDAICAVKAAVEDGVTVGGGFSLLCINNKFPTIKNLTEDEAIGVKIIKNALLEPFKQIALNAGKQGEVLLAKCDFKKGIGYNAKTDKFEDLYKSGIIDPTKVLKTVINNSISISSTFLTTECAIIYN